MHDPVGTADFAGTERFTFVDGTEEGIDFFRQAGVLPWDSGEPNNFFANEDCVE